MNDWLANVFNTRENIGAAPDADDAMKLAHAQVLDQVVQSHGHKLEDCTGEELDKIAQSIWGPDNPITKMAMEIGAKPFPPAKEEEKPPKEEPKDEKKEETAEEKVANAEALGRLMAHAYVDELAGIDKAAQEAAAQQQAQQVEKSASEKIQEIFQKRAAEAQPPAEQPPADINELIEKRAAEILVANGIDPSTGKEVSEQEKIAQEIDARARALLVSKGYQFEQ